MTVANASVIHISSVSSCVTNNGEDTSLGLLGMAVDCEGTTELVSEVPTKKKRITLLLAFADLFSLKLLQNDSGSYSTAFALTWNRMFSFPKLVQKHISL